jgi:hypothetical protein
MVMIPISYTKKPPDIQVYTVADLNETADWLEANLPEGWTVNRNVISMNVLPCTDGTSSMLFGVGDRIAVDANNKIFKIEKTILESLFDVV